jgi:hypothetical protein
MVSSNSGASTYQALLQVLSYEALLCYDVLMRLRA